MSKRFSQYAGDRFRCGLRIVSTLVLWSGLAGITQADECPGVAVQRVDRPPNIVMIVADDQRYSDFGFMGNVNVRTPHLDELAREAAVYTHAYVPQAYVAPHSLRC